MNTIYIVMTVALLAACSTSSGTTNDNATGPMNDPPAETAPAEVPEGPDVVLPEEKRAASTEPAEGEASDTDPSVSRAEVDAFMEKGPPHVLTLVTVEPSRNDAGAFVGYQIVDVTRGARNFMMPQLRVGDVVTHVNGIKQSKPDDLVNAWKALRQVDAVRVDFTRKGEPMTATWRIR